jgi:tRNA nucleotidyltransferase (CCA-adding enzyme)
MKIYLVGGAVRDSLLGLPVRERDWVVVGATPDLLLAKGYKLIGKDFPVFLDPKTHEEYALARTERKVGIGYKGFTCYAAPDVTLEQDLLRRDLTINAIAQDPAGHFIDPYGGQADLKAKVLRHISEAFSEDPVRVLRLARFAARFSPLGFTIAEETYQQVQQILDAGELTHLVPERVWQELEKVLAEPEPAVFFEVLAFTKTLSIIFPSWQGLYQDASLASLKIAVTASSHSAIRLASVLQHLPAQTVKQGCADLRLPTQFTELAVLSAQYRENFKRVMTFTPEETLNLLEALDPFRRAQRFQDLLQIWQTDLTNPLAKECAAHLQVVEQKVSMIKFQDLIQDKNLKGPDVKAILREARLEAISRI